MSYILDALKKSQQEREAQNNEHNTPSLRVDEPAKKDLRPWLTFATVIIFLLALWLGFEKFWASTPAYSPAPAPTDHATVQVPAPSIIKTPVAQMTAVALAPVEEAELTEYSLTDTAAPVFSSAKAVAHQAQSEQKTESKPESRPQEKIPEPKIESEKAQVDTTSEKRALPPLTTLRKIPALFINSHIYSSVAAQRSVTINNRQWREGDPLTQDVIIQAITPQGVLLQVDGYSITVNRSQGWQPIDGR
jgi:general secretion pathway protein B